jgi:hypothetical protein
VAAEAMSEEDGASDEDSEEEGARRRVPPTPSEVCGLCCRIYRYIDNRYIDI